MPSARFEQLTQQLSELRQHLLPREFDPTGAYDALDTVSTMALAYRVLAHAEIESYFEDQALEVVRQAHMAWDRGQVSRVALCLISFSGRVLDKPPATLEAPNKNKRKSWPMLVDVGQKFGPIAAAFFYFVRNENHGVKEKNLLSLLLPLGVPHTRIDPTFLADMESFGALRGTAAHSSSRAAATLGVDPQGELQRIEGLLPGIEAIDKEFEALMLIIPSEP